VPKLDDEPPVPVGEKKKALADFTFGTYGAKKTDQPAKVRSVEKLTPPIKWHGGKHYLAKRIVDLMPAHTHYVEPFAGGLAVLLAKNPVGVSEVANDLDLRLTNFWRVLQSGADFGRFQRIVEAVPFSEGEWQDAGAMMDHSDPVQRAVAFFIRCRQSLAGRKDTFAPLSRTRTRRQMNEQASAWITAIEGLPAVHARLRRVVVLNKPALDVIRSQDGEKTLFYLDPPYPHETRTACAVYGEFEMSKDDHKALLDLLRTCKGKVMLSAYGSVFYDMALSSWNRHDFDLPNNAAGGKAKRRMTEVIYTNF
jgi:DNA adenine methylase